MQTHIKSLYFTSENRAGSCLKLYIKSVAGLELDSNLSNPVLSQWKHKIPYILSDQCGFMSSFFLIQEKQGVFMGNYEQDMESGIPCRHHKKGAGKTRSRQSSLKNAIHTPYTRPRWDEINHAPESSFFFFSLTLKGALITSWKRHIHSQTPPSGPSPSHRYLPSHN